MLNDIEDKLIIKPYHIEWEYLDSGKNNKKHRRLTMVEGFLPMLFSVPFIITIICKLNLLQYT